MHRLKDRYSDFKVIILSFGEFPFRNVGSDLFWVFAGWYVGLNIRQHESSLDARRQGRFGSSAAFRVRLAYATFLTSSRRAPVSRAISSKDKPAMVSSRFTFPSWILVISHSTDRRRVLSLKMQKNGF